MNISLLGNISVERLWNFLLESIPCWSVWQTV